MNNHEYRTYEQIRGLIDECPSIINSVLSLCVNRLDEYKKACESKNNNVLQLGLEHANIVMLQYPDMFKEHKKKLGIETLAQVFLATATCMKENVNGNPVLSYHYEGTDQVAWEYYVKRMKNNEKTTEWIFNICCHEDDLLKKKVNMLIEYLEKKYGGTNETI